MQKPHQERDLPLLRTIEPLKTRGARQAIMFAGDRVSAVEKRGEIEPLEVFCADFAFRVYADERRKVFLILIVNYGSEMALG